MTAVFTRKLTTVIGTLLGFERGIFTALIIIEHEATDRSRTSWVEGLGGFALSSGNPPRGTPLAADFIIRVLEVCGADRWENLKGRPVYVLSENGSPTGLQHAADYENQFIFADWQSAVRVALKARQ